VGIAPPSKGADMGMDINIEMVENGVVVRTHDKTGEGEDAKYIDETHVFSDLDEFQEWFGGSHWSKNKKFNKEKGKIEDAITSNG
jgi:hypothetical protein